MGINMNDLEQAKGVSKVNPQVEAGFRQISNELFNAFIAINISVTESKVWLAILSETWGWGKKEAIITIGQLSKLTQKSPRSVSRAIKSLIENKLIFVEKVYFYKGNTNYHLCFCINKYYDLWTGDKDDRGDKDGQIFTKVAGGPPDKLGSNLTKSGITILKKKESIKKKEMIYMTDFEKILIKRWNSIPGAGKSNLTTSLSELLSDVLESVSESELEYAIQAYSDIVNNDTYYYDWKYISNNSAKHGLRGFINAGLKRADGGFSRFLKVNAPYDKHKRRIVQPRGSHFDEIRLNHTFYTLEFDPKSPLDTKKNTYMGVNTNKLERYDFYNTVDTFVLGAIKRGWFKPRYFSEGEGIYIEQGNARLRWLEECIVYLIRWKNDRECVYKDKTNEELLIELVKHHNEQKGEFGYE